MIRVECPSCGTKLRGPDNAAGKKIKCPTCGGAIPVPMPEEIYDPEPIDRHNALFDDDGPPSGAYDVDANSPHAPSANDDLGDVGEGRKPCPVCGEMIVASAAKCRFCGEVFDPKLKKAKAKAKGKSKSKKNYNSDDDDLSTSDIVLCLLCPGIACIASIVYMVQGKGKGLKIFGLSVIGNVVWGVIRVMIESSTNGPGGGP